MTFCTGILHSGFYEDEGAVNYFRSFLEGFNKLVTTGKNFWTVGIVFVVLVGGLYKLVSQGNVAILALLVGVAAVITLSLVGHVMHLNAKISRIYAALPSVHHLIHKIRDILDDEARAVESGVASQENQNDQEILRQEALELLLTLILNQTQQCFSEWTGKEVTAVLLLPHRSEEAGEHFKSSLYSENACPNRTKTTQPIKGGLARKVFNSDEAYNFGDLEQEQGKANFFPGRDVPFKWYKSAIMAHLKIDGQRIGVLAVDCNKKFAFRDKHLLLLPAFADACALAINLSAFGVLGNINNVGKQV